MHISRFAVLICSALLYFASLSPARAAEIPRTIAFQGVLKDAVGKPIISPTSVTFTLYDAETAGNAVWTETKNVTPGASGLFTTPLGSTTALTTVTFDKAYWVGVKAGTDAEMTPRLPMQSAPYALALPGVTIGNGSVGIAGNLTVEGQGTASVENVLNVFNGMDGPSATGNGAAIRIGYSWGAYYAKIASVMEGANPGFLRPSLAFYTMGDTYLPGSELERMRIASNGSVGIGTSSPLALLDVSGGALVRSGIRSWGPIDIDQGQCFGTVLSDVLSYDGKQMANYGLGWFNEAGSDPRAWLSGYGGITFFAGGAPRMRIYSSGDVGIVGSTSCQTLTLTSSRRYKGNVRPISSALDKISRLQGVSYDWDAAHGGKPDIGFIAEDVAKIVPELVTMEENGVDAKGMDYAHLTALLTEGIKEQQNQAIAQEKRIKALEAENADLKTRLERLESNAGKGNQN